MCICKTFLRIDVKVNIIRYHVSVISIPKSLASSSIIFINVLIDVSIFILTVHICMFSYINRELNALCVLLFGRIMNDIRENSVFVKTYLKIN